MKRVAPQVLTANPRKQVCTGSVLHDDIVWIISGYASVDFRVLLLAVDSSRPIVVSDMDLTPVFLRSLGCSARMFLVFRCGSMDFTFRTKLCMLAAHLEQMCEFDKLVDTVDEQIITRQVINCDLSLSLDLLIQTERCVGIFAMFMPSNISVVVSTLVLEHAPPQEIYSYFFVTRGDSFPQGVLWLAVSDVNKALFVRMLPRFVKVGPSTPEFILRFQSLGSDWPCMNIWDLTVPIPSRIQYDLL